mmetsp:Transcript_1697/g.4246  ORF Transcript_1697/g.4246 Transcript_1697/m.4246 type:complete len:227 (+) Transcript_1697:1254-1934(+)
MDPREEVALLHNPGVALARLGDGPPERPVDAGQADDGEALCGQRSPRLLRAQPPLGSRRARRRRCRLGDVVALLVAVDADRGEVDQQSPRAPRRRQGLRQGRIGQKRVAGLARGGRRHDDRRLADRLQKLGGGGLGASVHDERADAGSCVLRVGLPAGGAQDLEAAQGELPRDGTPAIAQPEDDSLASLLLPSSSLHDAPDHTSSAAEQQQTSEGTNWAVQEALPK